jgi:sulfatase maturation enzyme AslB (radical SAM superfamily)
VQKPRREGGTYEQVFFRRQDAPARQSTPERRVLATPNSRRCSFLPVCWAVCPKRHLDGDAHAVAEQGAYWRRNLARLVADGVQEELAGPTIFDQSVQFRG